MFLLTLAIAFSAWVIFSTSTTSPQNIHIHQIQALRDLVANNFSVVQEINIEFGDRGFRFPDLVEAAQLQLDFRLASDAVPYRYSLVDRLPKIVARPPTEIEWAHRREVILTEDTDTIFGSATTDITDTTDTTDTTDITDITDITGTANVKPTDATDAETSANIPEYSVELSFSDRPLLSMDLKLLRVYMAYDLAFIHQNDLPFYLTQAVYEMLIRPDLDMWKEFKSGQRKFSDVTRKLNVNFVAAEESGQTVDAITKEITEYMQRFEAVSSFVTICPTVHVLDVSKRRADSRLVKNTTSELTFFYSTTMRPYANMIQGVPLRHLDPVPRELPVGGDHYGTEYQQKMRMAHMDTYDVTSFIAEVDASIRKAIHLPKGTSNLRLLAETAMKHYTILGLTETLDLLLAAPVVGDTYMKVAKLVDIILQETTHDWGHHLTKVSQLYEDAKLAQKI